MRKIYWLLLSSLIAVGCGGEADKDLISPHFVGLSAFSAMNESFPCDDYLKELNKSPRPIMPVLYGTFGFDWSCIDKFIQQNRSRPHAVQIHLSNERCRYYERCEAGELEGDLDTIDYNYLLEIKTGWLLQKITARVQTIYQVLSSLMIKHKANTDLFLSTGLEDLYSQNAYNVIYETIRSSWPYEIIRVPLQNNHHHDLVEYHGVSVPCNDTTFASNDGAVLSVSGSAGFAAQHRECKATILWLPSLQGITNEFTKPLDRVFRFHFGDIDQWEAFLNG